MKRRSVLLGLAGVLASPFVAWGKRIDFFDENENVDNLPVVEFDEYRHKIIGLEKIIEDNLKRHPSPKYPNYPHIMYEFKLKMWLPKKYALRHHSGKLYYGEIDIFGCQHNSHLDIQIKKTESSKWVENYRTDQIIRSY